MSYTPGAVPEFTTPEEFIEAKLEMLRKELCIEPTEAELAKLNTATTENGINRIVHDIIDAHYEADDFNTPAPKKPGRKRKEPKV